METAMKIFEASKFVPNEEKYSLTDPDSSVFPLWSALILLKPGQVALIQMLLVSQLTDADSEAAESAIRLNLLSNVAIWTKTCLMSLAILAYDRIMGKIVNMMVRSEQ